MAGMSTRSSLVGPVVLVDRFGHGDDLVAVRGERRPDRADVLAGDTQLGQRGHQVAHHPVEVVRADAQPGVAGRQVAAGVLDRAAGHLGQQRRLVAAQPGQVDALEEVRQLRVGDHPDVEVVDCGADPGLLAETLVERHQNLRSTPVDDTFERPWPLRRPRLSSRCGTLAVRPRSGMTGGDRLDTTDWRVWSVRTRAQVRGTPTATGPLASAMPRTTSPETVSRSSSSRVSAS